MDNDLIGLIFTVLFLMTFMFIIITNDPSQFSNEIPLVQQVVKKPIKPIKTIPGTVMTKAMYRGRPDLHEQRLSEYIDRIDGLKPIEFEKNI